jgi:hypothetical protein
MKVSEFNQFDQAHTDVIAAELILDDGSALRELLPEELAHKRWGDYVLADILALRDAFEEVAFWEGLLADE